MVGIEDWRCHTKRKRTRSIAPALSISGTWLVLYQSVSVMSGLRNMNGSLVPIVAQVSWSRERQSKDAHRTGEELGRHDSRV